MNIKDLLKKQSIALGLEPMKKSDMIAELARFMDKSGNIFDLEKYIEDVRIREKKGTTGIGGGIAIPHAKSAGVKYPGIAAATVPEGTDYEAMDGEVSKLFFMIAVPENSDDEHLKVLSRLSTMLMDDTFKDDLLRAKDEDQFLRVIEDKEREKFPEDFEKVQDTQRVSPVPKTGKTGYDILAVTGCPTGIAHTYMAAEALIQKAHEMGYTIKVETHGSSGIENALTPQEIAVAKAIVIASDVSVEKSRFDGKKMISTKVADGVNKPKELLEKALDSNAPVYSAGGKAKAIEEESVGKESSGIAQGVYKHLMNGVSHMLPFVIGGGILIALAFLLDDYSIDPSNFGNNTPVAAFFNKIGGVAFGFMLPILAGFIAMSIADRPGLAVGFVGGYLASDGGSGFLGALVAGFLAGYIVLLLRKITEPMPKSLDGIKPMLIYPVFGILLIGVVMVKLLNPPLAVLNEGMVNTLNNLGGTSKAILGFLLGAMMAVDMGGPVNKAAYVFGTASLASGSSEIMAAVMAGGMVPPIAISLSMILFKNKYNDRERNSIVTNIIMGLSFITEGAIPFAAADPIRVIPSCIVGSGVAGTLSMLFGSSLRAPHGGLWVIGVISNPLGYIAAIAIGSVAAAVMLGLLKKDQMKV